MRRARLILLPLLLVIAACTDQITAPGVCPACLSDSIEVTDVVLDNVIVRDSAFRGYLQAWQAEAMPVADIPPGVVDSRAMFQMSTMVTRVLATAGGTDTVPIVVDSARLRLMIVRRDTNTANLRLNVYRLPLGIDSLTTFAQLDVPWFQDSLVDSVNVSDLLARPTLNDSATRAVWGDSIRTDSAGHTLQFAGDGALILFFDLDTIQAPFVVADSGQVAYGVRVAADSLASVALATSEVGGRGPLIRWFYHYTIPDTVSATPDSVVYTNQTREASFDSFVLNPPTPPLDAPAVDTTLVVGGVPSARSLLRVAFPSFLRDTVDVVRATLILVPVTPVAGAPGDSFVVLARPVLTDLGAKSPLSPNTALFGSTTIHIGSADTVRIELSNLFRVWAADTSLTTAFVLGQVTEAATYTEVRFYSSRTAFRPAMQVTYVRRFPFGVP